MENRKLGRVMGYILLGAALLAPLSKKALGKPVKIWGAYGAFAQTIKRRTA